jgi:hypothetical protein
MVRKNLLPLAKRCDAAVAPRDTTSASGDGPVEVGRAVLAWEFTLRIDPNLLKTRWKICKSALSEISDSGPHK